MLNVAAGQTTPNFSAHVMEERFLTLPEVLARTGLCKSTIYQQIRNGEFPSHIPLGARRVGWLSSEINRWIADRIAAARPSK